MSGAAARADNAELLASLREGEEGALDAIVDANIGLARGVALRFTGRGIDYEDLVQTGVIGLIKAARGFDPGRGCAFSTYAVPLIVGEIKRVLRDDGAVKVARELKRRAAAAARAKDILEQRLGREPRVSEVASETGMTVEETTQALCAAAPVRSLSEPVEGDGARELLGTLSDPEDAYEKIRERQSLYSAIGTLNGFERALVYYRYCRELSQSRTGKLLGVNQVKVSREERRILDKLRRELG